VRSWEEVHARKVVSPGKEAVQMSSRVEALKVILKKRKAGRTSARKKGKKKDRAHPGREKGVVVRSGKVDRDAVTAQTIHGGKGRFRIGKKRKRRTLLRRFRHSGIRPPAHVVKDRGSSGLRIQISLKSLVEKRGAAC